MSEIKAIETRYKGYRFRSRLEARWAVFFDAMGIPWEYEPQGFHLEHGPYLPDFFLPETRDRRGKPGVWVEIKGTAPTQHENDLCADLCAASERSVVMLVGTPPDDPDDLGSNDGGYQWNSYESGSAWWDNCMSLHFCESCRRGAATKFEFRNDYFTCPLCHAETCTYNNAFTRRAADAARSARFEHGETP